MVRLLLGVAAAALLTAAVVGLVDREDVAPSIASGPGQVTIADFAFAPTAVEVRPGTTVTWTNTDDAAHTVDTEEGDLLASGDIDRGGSYRQRFDAPGTYAYLCSIHPSMRGTVEVVA